MRLTMPQSIMLNHAAWVNYERMDKRVKAKGDATRHANEDPIVMNGKRLAELSSDEMQTYYSDMLS